MKYLNGFLFLLLALAGASCKKSFEEKPLEFITDEYIWDSQDSTGDMAQRWVAFIYSRIPTGYSRLNSVPLECASDDAVPSATGNATWNVIRGGYSPAATFDDNWGNAYNGIREANIWLNNYRRIPWASANLKRWLPAEVRAVRAYFYYELLKRYGGIPLLGEKVFAPNDPELVQLKRASFDSCVRYIVSEIEAVKDSLRPDAALSARTTDPDFAHMRKSYVLSIKAKVLLLAASPLFNPSSTPNLDFTGYPTYSEERWKAAADAAKAVMDMGLYALEANRYTLHLVRANRETIFMRNSDSRFATLYQPRMAPVGYSQQLNLNCEGRVSPTQELVDAFPMNNGKAITDPTSGYNPQNPYASRDPRLAQTVFYNGVQYLKRPVETFEGGLDKPNNNLQFPNQTVTGYYAKKFLADDANSSTFTATIYKDDGGFVPSWVIIRYADMLLMYAEAANEAGNTAAAYDQLKALRARAGIQAGTDGLYGLKGGMTKEEMRAAVRTERRIELAFEEQRFWDIRRWKIAKDVYGKTLHGVTIVRNGNGGFTYTPLDVVTPYFQDHMNLLPIALKETLVNPNIQQNPGYGQ